MPARTNPNTAAFDATAFLGALTEAPGIYRMLSLRGEVLYVGKAKNLKKRVASYFRHTGLSDKTRVLMMQVHNIEVTLTHTENEALLLENNLIKAHHPRFNILLRDDKSYPYIALSADAFPRLGIHRGAKQRSGRYFGPYPSAGAARASLNLLQKVFPIRQCEDSYYQNRTRPCLQYQIKRCTAPCVGLVDADTYGTDVRHAVMFLQGRSHQVVNELATRMEQAAGELAFERAARLRDQIATLRRIQEHQAVSGEHGDLDLVAAAARNGHCCVTVFYIRAGCNLGNKCFFPQGVAEDDAAEVLSAFLPQYYLARDIPAAILVSHDLPERAWLAEGLSAACGHRVTIARPQRGERVRWLKLALTNAEQALNTHLISRAGLTARFIALQQALGLPTVPIRLECFDISHSAGEATTASCVVFGPEGALKSDYRRFRIEDITPGDDYAALQQALTRRYARIKNGEGKRPDVLFIDGGRGQVHAVCAALAALGMTDLIVIGIAKGPARKPGLEQLHVAKGDRVLQLPPDSPALHLIQQLRDEAHRFALAGHHQARARARNTSVLEGIRGIGPKRRQQLLRQFGGLRELARAGIEDIATVPGMSHTLAEQIYQALHTGSR